MNALNTGVHACPLARSVVIVAVVALVGAPALSGCRQYRDRIDTINLAGGEAVAANKAIHTIDPWPPEAFAKRHNTSAKRLVVGARHYDEGPPKKAKDSQLKTK